MRSVISLVAHAAVLSSALLAQRTLVVDSANGPYRDIQSAVNAAASGDIVLVTGGGSYAGATIARGLSLLVRGSYLTSGLTITNLAQGERVTLKGLRFQDIAPYVGSQPTVCSNCAGTIHLDDVQSSGSRHGPALTIENCRHVTVSNSNVSAGATMTALVPVMRPFAGDVGIRCTNSSLLLANSMAFGWPVTITVPYHHIGNWSGLVATNARVVIAESRLSGAAAYCSGVCSPTGAPTPACIATTSTLAIGGAGTTLVAGQWVGFSPWCPTCGPGPAALASDAATTILRDPSSTLDISGGQVTLQSIATVTATGAAPGRIASCTLTYPTLVPSATFASFPGGPLATDPIGIWLDLPMAVQIDVGMVAGRRTVPVPVPQFFPIGLPASFQSVLLWNATLYVSTPATVALW